MNIAIPNLKKRSAFELGGELYRTPMAAAKKAAWRMILQKYPDMQDIKRVLWHECDCFDDHPHEGDYGRQSGWLWEVCPLHARNESGYFRRLQIKLTGSILNKWTKEGTQ